MPAKFITTKKTVPSGSEMKELYCATLVKNREVNLHEIAEALSENSTLNPVDCYGVMVGMAAQIAKHLQEGNVVNIEFLGTFRIWAKSTAVESPELVSEKTIGKPSVNFRPSVLMKQRISKTQFVPKK
ncbi:HU family DNA-binding protein [Chryseobacterium sp. MDT2-18]|uniref:HU family DNA-binding protein n=1 Tax=Chryseobacterium sp. MDT2-18 TaxID=1259136 RepID=UPI00277DEB19|nr:HU family DNA-binding protein [Chryseobacterium sp. MDT2-18]MDQ0478002.1 putative histone-like DNA-binding protein [Chryseobacterium sp. MDT2-18]